MKSFSVFLCGLLFGFQALACQDHLPLEGAMINLPIAPGSPAAGYFSVENKSKKLVTVTQIKSDDFGKIEIHETAEANGSQQMRRIEELRVGKLEKLELKPGGIHLMLFDPAKNIKSKKTSQLTFELSNGEKIKYEFALQ